MTRLTEQQFAGFRRAASRASRGQVCVPDVVMTVAEAIALWRDISAAFGPRHRRLISAANGAGRSLSAAEIAQLRRQAWRRSRSLANLSANALSLDAGLAFWRIAVKLGELDSRRTATPLARIAGAAALSIAATQMAACTSFLGGNIKGSFSCSAPGGTCAPSTVIDDQALSVIQNARPMSPAGPYFQGPVRRGAPVSARAPSGRGRSAAAGEGMAHRERRVLKVVFPSYVDGAGNLHEPRVVHTVADEGGWMQLSSGAPNVGEQVAARSSATAPDPHALMNPAALPSPASGAAASVPVSAADQAVDGTQGPGGPPDPSVVAQARAKGLVRTAPSPLAAIKAEVEARLAQTPRAAASGDTVPAAPPAKPAPAPALQTAANGTAGAASTPALANPPAGFSGKVEE